MPVLNQELKKGSRSARLKKQNLKRKVTSLPPKQPCFNLKSISSQAKARKKKKSLKNNLKRKQQKPKISRKPEINIK